MVAPGPALLAPSRFRGDFCRRGASFVSCSTSSLVLAIICPLELRGECTRPGPQRQSSARGEATGELLAAPACSALGTDHMGSTDRRQKTCLNLTSESSDILNELQLWDHDCHHHNLHLWNSHDLKTRTSTTLSKSNSLDHGTASASRLRCRRPQGTQRFSQRAETVEYDCLIHNPRTTGTSITLSKSNCGISVVRGTGWTMGNSHCVPTGVSTTLPSAATYENPQISADFCTL